MKMKMSSNPLLVEGLLLTWRCGLNTTSVCVLTLSSSRASFLLYGREGDDEHGSFVLTLSSSRASFLRRRWGFALGAQATGSNPLLVEGLLLTFHIRHL